MLVLDLWNWRTSVGLWALRPARNCGISIHSEFGVTTWLSLGRCAHLNARRAPCEIRKVMSLATDSLRLVRGSHDSQAGHFSHSNHVMGENLDLQTGSTWLNFSQSSLGVALLTVAGCPWAFRTSQNRSVWLELQTWIDVRGELAFFCTRIGVFSEFRK
jgi:hypothetical protein